MAKKKRVSAASIVAEKKKQLEGLSSKLDEQNKNVLVQTLIELANRNAEIRRSLELKFDVEVPISDLVRATRAAIVDATDFDERDMNTNFKIDYGSYEIVRRNFKRLIQLKSFSDVMELATELMSSGSYQVEMSDEGMMSSEIEEAVELVAVAVEKANLPDDRVLRWCDETLAANRDGLLDTERIERLRKQVAGRIPSTKLR